MKNYAALLKDYIGKNGELSQQDNGWIFSLQTSELNNRKTKLSDFGADYAEFTFVDGYRRFIPLNLLVLDVE
jgi:hypothetical protein